MKARIALLALLLSGALAGANSAATSVSAGIHIGPSGRASVDLGFFYDDLASYGNWVERPQYGWVWTPRAVATGWRPYQEGHWVWTDDGWTWISDEPYGWATYHYGRWYDDPDYGWEWVPGDEWAPAWVSWQEGSDYVGWAPLPPDYRPGISFDFATSIAPEEYVFVPERQFLAPRIAAYVVAQPTERVRIYRQTRNITRYQVVNQRVVNQGVPVENIQRVVGRPVPRYHVTELNADQRHSGARVAQNQVALFRPQVQRTQVAPPPQRPVARRAVITPEAAAARVRPNRAPRAIQGSAAPTAPVPPAAQGPQDNGQRRRRMDARQAVPTAAPENPGDQQAPNPNRRMRARPVTPQPAPEAQQAPPPSAQDRRYGRQQRAREQTPAPQPQADRQPQPRADRQPPQADRQPPPRAQRPPQADRRQEPQQRPPQAQQRPQGQNKDNKDNRGNKDRPKNHEGDQKPPARR